MCGPVLYDHLDVLLYQESGLLLHVYRKGVVPLSVFMGPQTSFCQGYEKPPPARLARMIMRTDEPDAFSCMVVVSQTVRPLL